MKTLIRDNEALAALNPQAIAAYLRSHEWKQERLLGDKGAIWTNPGGFEVLLPLRKDLDDYPARVSDVLQVLERVEERSQLLLFTDLSDTTADLIRLHLLSPVLSDGSLPLVQASRVVSAAKDMMLAAACAALEPRPVYTARKPDKALEYLQGVRLGQTERGSYVLTIRSAVPPQLTGGQPGLFPENPALVEEPFERKVTLTLARSLGDAYQAAVQSGVSSDFTPFAEAIERGASANLLAAVGEMGEGEIPLDVQIGFQWAPIRPVPDKTSRRVRFTHDSLPILREAARLIRERAPQDAFLLEGNVTVLKRTIEADRGEITVAGFVEGKLSSVKMTLPPDEYRSAIEAHEKRQPISCEGELVRVGNFYRLENPRRFTLLTAGTEE